LLFPPSPGEVRATDGSGAASERFEAAVLGCTLAARGEVFATIFFAAGTLFCTIDLAAALSFSR
jgi:hypothetical protein